MTLRRIEKSQWADFCELMSSELVGKRAAIEIASRQAGLQVEADGLPVVGMTYDARSDAIEIVLEGLDHMISHPLELYAEFGFAGIEHLAIVEGDTWQIVVLRTPLMLPSPH